MTGLDEQLRRALQTQRPLVYLHSAEEDRIAAALQRVAGKHPVLAWTCTGGLDGGAPDTRNPVAALEAITAQNAPAYFLFKDLPDFMSDPEVVRKLRDSYSHLSSQAQSRLFILSPVVRIPDTLRRDVHLLELPPPDTEELVEEVQRVLCDHGAKVTDGEMVSEIALSLRGLSRDDARYILHGILNQGSRLTKRALFDEIRVSKKSIAGGAGYLEYVYATKNLEQIGGLSYFKSWLEERANIFDGHAMEAGLPIPGGILITGISGCGKSLCAKVVAKTWNVPLYRLDMNLVFAELYGNPEATFHKALQTIESMAPAVLWIDEIENGFGFEQQPGAVQSHIFSAFLTWMQEKPPLVFVAATANRIENLPAELIRKGRFDQVFFVDLPDESERQELFSIHLRGNGADPDQFDIPKLVIETEDWNGAEIEQLIKTARVATYREKRPFNTRDILLRTRQIVPLSRTMNEQIKSLRNWAWNRATPASKGKGTDYSILEKVPASQ